MADRGLLRVGGNVVLYEEDIEAYSALISQEKKTVNDLLDSLMRLLKFDTIVGIGKRGTGSSIAGFVQKLSNYLPPKDDNSRRALEHNVKALKQMHSQISNQINSIFQYLSFFGTTEKKRDEILEKRIAVLRMKKAFSVERSKFLKRAEATLGQLADFVQKNEHNLKGNSKIYGKFLSELESLKKIPDPSALFNLLGKAIIQIDDVELAMAKRPIYAKGVSQEEIHSAYDVVEGRPAQALTRFRDELKVLQSELLAKGAVGASYRGWQVALRSVRDDVSKVRGDMEAYLQFGYTMLGKLRDNVNTVRKWIVAFKATREPLYAEHARLLQAIDVVDSAYKATQRTYPQIKELEKRLAA